MKRTIILMCAAVLFLAACGKRTEVQTVWPSPTPVTVDQLEKLLAQRFPSPTPQPRATLIPNIQNPWETEEDRMLQKRKHGFTLVDEKGEEYLRIHRRDDDDVGKGIVPRDFVMESNLQPQVTNVGGKFETVFVNEVPTPVPTGTP